MVTLILTLIAYASAAEPTPIERATLVLVRTLSYDREIGRGNGELRVAVVHGQSLSVRAQTMATLGGLRGVTVSGRPLGAAVELAADVGNWSTKLKGYDAVVLCPDIDAALPEIVAAARALDVLLLSLEPKYVGAGAAIGVSVDGSRLQIRGDPKEALDQGAELTAELLEVAVLVGR